MQVVSALSLKGRTFNQKKQIHICSWCGNKASKEIHDWCKTQVHIFQKTELPKVQNPRAFRGRHTLKINQYFS